MPKRFLPKLFAALGAVLLLSACKAEVLAPTGDIAAQQRDLLVISTLLMLIIIVPVMLLTCWFAWHFRSSNATASYQPNWSHSTKLELIIWAIPLLIVVTLGALTWVGTHLLDPYRPLARVSQTEPLSPDQPPLDVQVVALDWKWLFIYPEYGVAAVNELPVPVDRPIRFTLTSSSVMNAFYIPSMAGMIYAMPGMQTTLHGVFNAPGEYQGLASHYSGAGFSGMRFKAKVTDNAGFEAWIETARNGKVPLDRKAYLELERPTENVRPAAYTSVDPQLFARVVNMCVEEGKICMAEMMAIDAQGGSGLAGTVNMSSLIYDKHERRGMREPVFGWEPFKVVGFCSMEELDQMLAAKPASSGVTPIQSGPLRGHGMPQPVTPFGGLEDRYLTLMQQSFGNVQQL
ncbi:ubiquinol oxidase subunit II [Pararhizobium antarcticum]|uniref:Ubiquinol oxidase polypeptide II n=1 Tax=Pararhizobium antarcticum TaxID=1798805 RepID=A0A657LW49_9HYPH|nr:ubiquinol oxidase subunit II [Pararhizobium antarcticum]OJF96392.1 cytochrome ubiquinol oxidase subunit II [Pararhizobium antarcticum]OJF96723.1 cytochrome ubiquinol oxidase subunit II [Rhizobium sp. 58]